MNDAHDVVVIGGSLAGAACVRELERLGFDAIALERDRFPRRKVCGGFLSPGAVQAIAHLGLLNQLLNAGAVFVRSARISVHGVEVEIPFDRPALGISRNVLDEIVARGARVRQGHLVHEVRRCDSGFIVDGIGCSVVIDASGKLGRFTKRRRADEFGIQYSEPGQQRSVLDFRFFKDGYGGGVSVEGGRSNWCFLITKSGLQKYLGRSGCLVTGPLAYDRLPGEFIAIGDAAGMVDPFCGEGMRQALESGVTAARVVAAGIRRGARYEEMKWEYEAEWERRWGVKRALGAFVREKLLPHPWLFSSVVGRMPAWVMNRLWA
jgi:flavin-dependent dehydrogenase